jgi:benzoyl-CoA reductase/2-hydroxyglutaryl-CoA dehydratase subunit BcrC/BadD/HgdB
MDIPWYTISQMPFLPTSEPYILDEIDEAEGAGLGTDMCTLIRLGINNLRAGRMPVPTALVGLLSPCDAADMLHQAISRNKDWRDIPFFCTDPPYFGDDRGVDFHARELRRMVSFLEEHMGCRFDVDRLREVIAESNRQYELWAEYNELRRAVPCPHSAAKGAQAWNVAQNYMVGDKKGTEWFRSLVDITEKRVSEGTGSMPDERIRLFWFDIRAVWFPEVTMWLKDEWGACIVMDMTGYAPYTQIDTASEESMLKGLAKRNLCDVPMVRQVRGTSDTLISDIIRVVKDYKIDCVVWPAHMGHKDGGAGLGIMRDVCREIGVPFLELGLDLFDKRYTTTDEIKDKFSQYFTAMDLG